MTTFARRIRPAVLHEIDEARRADARGDRETAFRYLERSHILGQAATVEHVRAHWHMLRWAIRHQRPGEALGQAWRLIAAALLTGLGWVPEGNTGGANVSGIRRMAIPPDLQRIIDNARR